MNEDDQTYLEVIAGAPPVRPMTEADRVRAFRRERSAARAAARRQRGYQSRSQERWDAPPWQHIGRVRRVSMRPGSPWRGHRTTMRTCHRLRVAAVQAALALREARKRAKNRAH